MGAFLLRFSGHVQLGMRPRGVDPELTGGIIYLGFPRRKRRGEGGQEYPAQPPVTETRTQDKRKKMDGRIKVMITKKKLQPHLVRKEFMNFKRSGQRTLCVSKQK